jgi:hypothetical protein
MKSIILFVVLGVATACAQTEGSKNKQAGNTQQRLMQIEQEMVDDLIKADSSGVER